MVFMCVVDKKARLHRDEIYYNNENSNLATMISPQYLCQKVHTVRSGIPKYLCFLRNKSKSTKLSTVFFLSLGKTTTTQPSMGSLQIGQSRSRFVQVPQHVR